MDAHYYVVQPDGDRKTRRVFIARVVRDLKVALLVGIEENVVLAVSFLFAWQPLAFF
jgi:hypothetical protein